MQDSRIAANIIVSERPAEDASDDVWTTHAEECLFLVAHDLRRIALQPDTKRLHLHALELKRTVMDWRRTGPPEMSVRLQLLAEVEALARAVRRQLDTRARVSAVAPKERAPTSTPLPLQAASTRS